MDIKQAAGLFTPKAVLEDLGRMSRLLQVPVRADDSLSEYTCRGCKSATLAVKKKLKELRDKAQSSYRRHLSHHRHDGWMPLALFSTSTAAFQFFQVRKQDKRQKN